MNVRFVVMSVAASLAACGSGGGGGPGLSSAHPRIYLPTNHDRLVTELASGRPAATRWQAAVDRWTNGSDVYNFGAWNAALMGQLTGQAKYCTAAIAAIDMQVTTANMAIASGTAPVVAQDDYLDIGDLVGDLALVYDWCYPTITTDQRTAWLAYADQAVWNVWNHDAAKWGDKTVSWTGWATDDPSDNYYYSFLRATMLLGLAAHNDLPDADMWITEFHDTKLTNELLPTFNTDLVGGGSREGTGYGVSMRGLFELYDLWQGSTGEDLATLTAHTRASMLAFIHQTLPTLDRVAPTGDQSRDATASLFDYHRDYFQKLVSLFPDDPLSPRIQRLLADSSVPKMANDFMFVYDFLYDNADVAPTTLDGLGTAYYAPGIGELYARSGWDKHATWVNLIAGPYTESHAHQDQGALMIYKDGWLAYDPVIDSHSGLPQQVEAHSVVRLDDGGTIEQRVGTESKLAALHTGTGWLHAAADLTPAYMGKATVTKIQRELVYLEPDCVVVYDRVATQSGTQIWQLASPVAPTINGASATITTAMHTLNVQRLAPASATASVHDYTADGDFSSGFRLDETMPSGDQRYLHVLWIDGAVGNAVAQGPDGVTVTLAGGGTASISFDHDQIGGSLTIGGTTTTLGATLDSLPE